MADRKFRFGVSGRGDTLAQWKDFARKAEDLGYASLDLPDHFARQFSHPELGRALTLDTQLQSYAWHSRHHVAHIAALRQRQGW